jgi:hypothetical protein
MQLVHKSMEFIKEVFLFPFQVLELLEFDFVFPLHVPQTTNDLFNFLLALFKF